MTSTNDGKDVKSNQASGPKGKSYYIDLYKSLDGQLNSDCGLRQRTLHLCEAWRRIHTLCQHSTEDTHTHLFRWIQTHTAKTVLQSEWRSPHSIGEHTFLEEAINWFINECHEAIAGRGGQSPPWEAQLLRRAEWHKATLSDPWGHPILKRDSPTDEEVLEWVKGEQGVMVVARLRQLAASKCGDVALKLASAVMRPARAAPPVADPDQVEGVRAKLTEYEIILRKQAGFTTEVWEFLIDIEFVLLHKGSDRTQCIELAKQTPIRSALKLVERLHGRLTRFPKEKKLWKNAKDVAILIAQVMITRCMVLPVCTPACRAVLKELARALARLLRAALPAAAARLAAPAATAAHLHALAAALHPQCTEDMKPMVCELYVRAITAGMNELEKLKLKTEKASEARSSEVTLAVWFMQLGSLLGASTRIKCECTLTAFSVHPSPANYERIKAAPSLQLVALDIQEPKGETKSDYGSWANDSRGQTNFVKTSETLNMKETQHQANVLSIAILAEGEGLGLTPELCQDIAVVLSGPRVKTLSWDMDRELLLENCRTYMERTHGGTRALTTVLEHLNLDPSQYQHLPEEEEDESDVYYGIQKGYEDHVEFQEAQPEEIWEDSLIFDEETESADSNCMEGKPNYKPRRKKKTKQPTPSSEDESDPLSLIAEGKQLDKKKERPHSKERSKTDKKKTKNQDTKKERSRDRRKDESQEPEKKKKERKKKQITQPTPVSTSMSKLIGVKVAQVKIPGVTVRRKDDNDTNLSVCVTDSEYDSQGKSFLNSEGNQEVLYDGQFSMDELKSPERRQSIDTVNQSSLNKREMNNSNCAINKSLVSIQKNISSQNSTINKQGSTSTPDLSIGSIVREIRSTTHQISNKSAQEVKEEVRQNITKLLQFRKQKNAMSEDSSSSSSSAFSQKVYNNSTTMQQELKKTDMSTLVGSKIKTASPTPKLQMNKTQAQKLHMLKNEVNSLLINTSSSTSPPTEYLNKRYKRYKANTSNTCSRVRPINFSYAKKSEISRQPSAAVPNPQQCPTNLSMNNKATPQLISPPISVQSTPEQKSLIGSHQNSYQKFLMELQGSLNAGLEPEKKAVKPKKKPMKPVDKLTPVAVNVINTEPTTSPLCAKPMQPRKAENAPNTFSRLNYTHKNKQSETKPKALDTTQNQLMLQNSVSAELDQRIADITQSNLKYNNSNYELAVSRENNTPQAQRMPGVMVEKIEKSPLKSQFPALLNILHDNTSLLKSNHHEMKQAPPQQTRISQAPSSVSSLSEKDQQDLVHLWRQKSKLNLPVVLTNTDPSTSKIVKSLQYLNTSVKSNINNNLPFSYTPVPAGNSSVLYKQTEMESDFPLQNTDFDIKFSSMPNANIKKVNNVIQNTFSVPSQPKLLNVDISVLNSTTKANEPKRNQMILKDMPKKIANKSAAKQYNVIKSNNSKQQDWASVLDDIRSHATPSRGPTALDIVLKKDTFSSDSLRKQRIHKVRAKGDSEQVPKTVIITNQPRPVTTPKPPSTEPPLNKKPVVSKPIQSAIPKSQNQLHGIKINNPHNVVFQKHVSSETTKKFTEIRKDQDPLLSDIPNSDYDSLEALMDDDLRQEIGELLCDDETYPSPALEIPKPSKLCANVNNASNIILNKPVNSSAKKPTVIHSFISNNFSKAPETSVKPVISTNATKQAPFIISNVRISFPNDTSRRTTNMTSAQPPVIISNQTISYSQENISCHTNVMQHVPKTIIASNSNEECYKVNRNLVSNSTTCQSTNIDPTMASTLAPSPTIQNVVILNTGIVYNPYQTLTHPGFTVNQNTIMSVGTPPNITLYQANQYAAPVVNPLLQQPLPVSNSVEAATVTIEMPYTAEQLPTNITAVGAAADYKTMLSGKPAMVKTVKSVSTMQNELNSHSAKAMLPLGRLSANKKVDNKSNNDFNSIKNCERKVLSEMQEKQEAITHENSDIKTCRNQRKSFESDGIKHNSKDNERLLKKRLAIINRKIHHRCDDEPIPLCYVPLTMNKHDNVKNDEELAHINTTIKDEVYPQLRALDDCPTTPDSLGDVENTAQEPIQNSTCTQPCRRILLRSSNQVKGKLTSVLIKKTKRKAKVRLKVGNPAPVQNENKSDLPKLPEDIKKPLLESDNSSMGINNDQNTTDNTTKDHSSIGESLTAIRASRRILNRKTQKPKQTSETIPKNPAPKITKKEIANVTNEKPTSELEKKYKVAKNKAFAYAVHEKIDKVESLSEAVTNAGHDKVDITEIKTDLSAEAGVILTNTCDEIHINGLLKDEEAVDPPSKASKGDNLSVPALEPENLNIAKSSNGQIDLPTIHLGPIKNFIISTEVHDDIEVMTPIKEAIFKETEKISKMAKLVKEIEDAINVITETTISPISSYKTVAKLHSPIEKSISASMKKEHTVLSTAPNIVNRLEEPGIDKKDDPKKAKTFLQGTEVTSNLMVNNKLSEEQSIATPPTKTGVIPELSFIDSGKPLHVIKENNAFKETPNALEEIIDIDSDTESNSKKVVHTKPYNYNENLDRQQINNAEKLPNITENTDIPQAYKDSIKIEKLPSPNPNNTNQNCLRIKLPNGKVYKATISGKAKCSFDTIFSEPALKNILLSGLTDKKLYTFNIEQFSTENNTIVNTRVKDMTVTTKNIPSSVETVNLVSDDEGENDSQRFNTEFGSYNIRSLDNDSFKKHQDKFSKKCSVKIIKYIEKECHVNVTINSNIQNSPQNNTTVKDPNYRTVAENLLKDLCSNLLIPDNVKEDSILSQKSTVSVLPLGKPPPVIEIGDSSDESNHSSIVQSISSVSPKATIINEFKNLLLKDLGVEDFITKSNVSNQKNMTPQNSKKSGPKKDRHTKNKPPIIPPIDSDERSELDKKKYYAKIIERKCFVKLSKCDDMLANTLEDNETESELDIKDFDDDFDDEDTSLSRLTRSGSFSILNDLEVFTEGFIQPTIDARSSPVIDIFETIANLRNLQDYGANSPVMEVYDMISTLKNNTPKIAKISDVQDLPINVIETKCQSDWFLTKRCLNLESFIRCSVKAKETKNVEDNTITEFEYDGLTDSESSDTSFSLLNFPDIENLDSSEIFEAPSLFSIMTKYFKDNALVYQLCPISNLESHDSKTLSVIKLKRKLSDKQMKIETSANAENNSEGSHSKKIKVNDSKENVNNLQMTENVVLEGYGSSSEGSCKKHVHIATELRVAVIAITEKSNTGVLQTVQGNLVENNVQISDQTAKCSQTIIINDLDTNYMFTDSEQTMVPVTSENSKNLYVNNNEEQSEQKIITPESITIKPDEIDSACTNSVETENNNSLLLLGTTATNICSISDQIKNCNESSYTYQISKEADVDALNTEYNDLKANHNKNLYEVIMPYTQVEVKYHDNKSDITRANNVEAPIHNPLENDLKYIEVTEPSINREIKALITSGDKALEEAVILKTDIQIPKKPDNLDNTNSKRNEIVLTDRVYQTFDKKIMDEVIILETDSQIPMELEILCSKSKILNEVNILKTDSQIPVEVERFCPDSIVSESKIIKNVIVSPTTINIQETVHPTVDILSVQLRQDGNLYQREIMHEKIHKVLTQETFANSDSNRNEGAEKLLTKMLDKENKLLGDDQPSGAVAFPVASNDPLDQHNTESIPIRVCLEQGENMHFETVNESTTNQSDFKVGMEGGIRDSQVVLVSAIGDHLSLAAAAMSENDVTQSDTQYSIANKLLNTGENYLEITQTYTLKSAEESESQGVHVSEKPQLLCHQETISVISQTDSQDSSEKHLDHKEIILTKADEYPTEQNTYENETTVIESIKIQTQDPIATSEIDTTVPVTRTQTDHIGNEFQNNNDNKMPMSECLVTLVNYVNHRKNKDTTTTDLKNDHGEEVTKNIYPSKSKLLKEEHNRINTYSLACPDASNDESVVIKIPETLTKVTTNEGVNYRCDTAFLIEEISECDIGQHNSLESDPSEKPELIKHNNVPTELLEEMKNTIGKEKSLQVEEDNNKVEESSGINVLESNTTLLYKDNSGVILTGIDCGTCYVFPIDKNSDSSHNSDIFNESSESLVDVFQEIEVIASTNQRNLDSSIDLDELDLMVLKPQVTYSKRGLKRKRNMKDGNINEKRARLCSKRKIDTFGKLNEKKYRKGKNIDYPKLTVTAIKESSYAKEFSRLLDYYSAIGLSYSLSYSKEQIYVPALLKQWPIQGTCTSAILDEFEDAETLFIDVDTHERTISDPMNQPLVEEISAEDHDDYESIQIEETNFNMGFGERSDRVIQNLEDGSAVSKLSAATLSDVKQTQPFLLSVGANDYVDISIKSSKHDPIHNLSRYMTYIRLKEKVRSFFKKTTQELNQDWVKERMKGKGHPGEDIDAFHLHYLNIEPLQTEAVVQVVQVGQLPVSAAAQNPVTCDPRVTQVSNASPPQCSVENSPRDDSRPEIKTEYTELTTADLSMPLLQEYAQHNQTITMHSQENNTTNDENIPIETELIKSEVKIELVEESAEEKDELEKSDEYSDMLHNKAEYSYGTNSTNSSENNEMDRMNNDQNNLEYSYDTNNTLSNENSSTIQNTIPKEVDNLEYHYKSNNTETTMESETNVPALFHSPVKDIPDSYSPKQNGSTEKTDQIAHAMSAAGITPTEESDTNTRTQTLVNILSQKMTQNAPNTYSKTSFNAMALQQALAQILPPPLNQTNSTDSNQQQQNTQVLHIVQSKNASGNQLTLVENGQQSVINSPNTTSVLHIVQNKPPSSGTPSNGTATPQAFGGLSLVDAGMQQGGNQLLHIVNTGNQKGGNAGQLLKRVNLLTNLANVQGSSEQKMVQFVCKSADGKAIQLNAPHQRSMVLRLQPIETPAAQNAVQKPIETQDQNPTSSAPNALSNKDSAEIRSRSIYEENYAKFIQNSSNKPSLLEKSTSLPKFNQAFGKPVFQDQNQKQIEMNGNNSHLTSPNTESTDVQPSENNINLEHLSQINSPPLLLRKSPAQTSQAQPNLVQQIKQTIAPMNIQTMHGGVIYTRQIPVNIGGGQTINLITVPSTELTDESGQKQSDIKFVNQGDMEHGGGSIIKIVPQSQTASNADGSSEEGNNHLGTNENTANPQPQQVLTQMRIKLPMLSKNPQMVAGTRVVGPSFFQIQRNVIGGANQPVYQQLVLTAAPPLGQQTIRLPQAQTRQIKVPTESQSSESQMSSSTLEQLREFDMVLEQVKERSTVQPNGNSNNTFKPNTTTTDTTESTASSTTSTETTQQVIYSIGTSQPLSVAYVNRKATVSTPTTSTFVRSPDSSGIADSPSSSSHVQIPHTVIAEATASESSSTSHHKPVKVSSKSKSRPKISASLPSALKLNSVPPKPSNQKPIEDEQTTQRILYILAEYKEQVENSPDKDKPAPRRRSNVPSNPPGSSKRKKNRRPGGRDISPIGDETCRTMGSEDSSCGTSQGDCTESCLEPNSPQESPRKVVRKLTFENEPSISRPQPQRNVIVADGQTITVARGASGKPATAVLMPTNYILPVSMVKGGQQIAIVTNRGPKLLTVGGEGGATNALLLQRLIGPGGLKPVLTRPGVRHVRLPTAALHNLQAFNLTTTSTVQPPDSTASPVPEPVPPEFIETQTDSSPWADHESECTKPDQRSSSPEDSEPWNLPSSANPHEYSYEETVRTDNMDRTVLDAIPDRYSPDMEAQRIFDKMFDVDSKKSFIVDDSPRCGYDIDASDDDKPYHQVVQKKDLSHRHHRLTHVSAAALRHKYAILEHELRLQKSLSEECEDLGVDSPSASELFPEAELLFAASPAPEHAQDHAPHAHTPLPLLNQTVIQADIDDQIATDQLLPRDMSLGLEDVGIVTVSSDGTQATITLDHEEFARAHPNTTFHREPTEDDEVQPYTITGLKGRHITSTIFHSSSAPATVLMTAPQATVISQASADSGHAHTVKYSDIDNMIDSLPNLVKDDGLTRFDTILTDSRELHLSNTASAIVHSAGNATQVIRRVCYGDDKRDRDVRYLMDEPDTPIAGDDAKMIAEDSSRDATVDTMADDDNSSPERHAELFWESNSASERSTRPLDSSSDSDKCCKSPSYDETNSTDSDVGTHMRLDSVIKEARGSERSGSADCSSAEDAQPPLRTYPAKRPHRAPHASLSGKTHAGVFGKTHASVSGKTHADVFGKTHAGVFGKTHAGVFGKTYASSSGNTHASSSGNTHASVSGNAHAGVSGKTYASYSGNAHAGVSGKTYASLSGTAHASVSGKSRDGEPSPRRRAPPRGVAKRGCPCCSGEPAPAPSRPKKPRQRKPTMDFNAN